MVPPGVSPQGLSQERKQYLYCEILGRRIWLLQRHEEIESWLRKLKQLF